jgi:ketosteroid isomerase-like protein
MPTIPEVILSLESAALERWGKGDPGGFLAITAPDVVYFDPYIGKRIDGRAALEEYYRAIWGKVFFDRFELLDPCVQVEGDLAVLTFNYVSYRAGVPDRWNCTEVFRRDGQGTWSIVQTHWSYTEVFKYKMNNQP